MAVRAVKVTKLGDGTIELKWEGLLNGDTGAWAHFARYPDKTMQVIGTFSIGGTCTLEGSNDAGTTAGAVHDAQGAAIAPSVGATENDVAVLAESPQALRPNITAGDGSTDVDCIILCVIK